MDEIKSGKYKYKCRACGVEYYHTTCSSYANMRLNLFSLIVKGISEKFSIGGKAPGLLDEHYCDTKNGTLIERIGIADLVALVAEPVPRLENDVWQGKEEKWDEEGNIANLEVWDYVRTRRGAIMQIINDDMTNLTYKDILRFATTNEAAIYNLAK